MVLHSPRHDRCGLKSKTMKREIERPPKVALCRVCKGSGRVEGEEEGEFHTCLQCEGSGRVTVSCQMTLDIRPYKPKPLNRH